MTSTESTASTETTVTESAAECSPELLGVADGLAELAVDMDSRFDAPVGETLRRLAGQLRTGGETLAGKDLVAAYPPEVVLPDRVDARAREWVKWVAVARDVLLFLPLLITWWGLFDALSNWQPVAGQSFLSQWRSGLTDTAEWIGLVILVVIILTVALPVLERRADALASAEDERRRLGELLAYATVLLAAPAGSSVVRVGGAGLAGASPEDLVARISWAAEQVVKEAHGVGERVARALGADGDEGLDALVGRFDDALERWTEVARAVDVAAATLRTPGEVVDKLAELRTRAADDERRLRAELELLIGQLHTTSEKQAAQAEAQQALAEWLAESTRRLAESLEFFHARAQDLGEFIDQLREFMAQLDGLRAGRGL